MELNRLVNSAKEDGTYDRVMNMAAYIQEMKEETPKQREEAVKARLVMQREAETAQSWEYCELLVTRDSFEQWEVMEIVHTSLPSESSPAYPIEYKGRIIAKLGLEGWELISVVTTKSYVHEYDDTSYYFKRLRQES